MRKDYVSKQGITDQIVYHEPLYGDEKNLILKRVKILIFPTKISNEAFPLVILEAS